LAPDGLIEGVVRKDTLRYPCYIGVQWHPERSTKNQPLVEGVGSFFVHQMLMLD
jgi:gamma-glutamyl-gamma-aminobutyrate hydrolase PuuD